MVANQNKIARTKVMGKEERKMKKLRKMVIAEIAIVSAFAGGSLVAVATIGTMWLLGLVVIGAFGLIHTWPTVAMWWAAESLPSTEGEDEASSIIHFDSESY